MNIDKLLKDIKKSGYKATIEEVEHFHFSLTFPTFIREKIEEGVLTFDLRGHWKSERIDRKFILEKAFSTMIDIPEEGKQYFFEWKRSNHITPLDNFVLCKEKSVLFECYCCGEEISLETDGRTVRATSECPYPQGIPPFELTLSVPSGKIIFDNDLREYYGGDTFDYEKIERIDGEVEKHGKHININKEIGLVQYSKLFEPEGLIICFCGNSCPGIFRMSDGSFAIGTDGWGFEEDENGEILETEEPFPGETLGGITTDLWWWCAVDYDDFIRREQNPAALRHATIIDVEPGTYVITQYCHTLEDRHEPFPQVYATIRKVEE